jgi:LPS export ABC transporter protein LptC
MNKTLAPALIILCFFSSCSFDYGDAALQNSDQPDIEMSDVEYVRVRNGEPLLRFTAESVERYEKKQTMELSQCTFEQFQNQGSEVNIAGSAGKAHAETDTGNIQLENGIRVEVKSEDITIETEHLYWRDQPRTVSSKEDDTVHIARSDGTSFDGTGFSADARNWTWEFKSGISGIYFQNDDED